MALLNNDKVIAIGEIGLDLYWRNDNIAKQKEIFIKQIKLAIKHDLPVVIHTRNSFSEAFECVKPFKDQVKGVFHCFSSTLEDALKAVDYGFYIGIDGPVTFKNAKDIIFEGNVDESDVGKLREGMPIGAKVTLRRVKMYEFFDRLVSISLPRVRDFRGINNKGFDGRGNYNFGITEQIIFPEINIDKVSSISGMDLTFVTTAKTDAEAMELLKLMGLPFKK